ncbi:MAG TPA: hypothetical protein VFH61_06485, partial [Thermoleophilia bacterium]|nr:hypothetical protein [Thermoleophilia bacterium]
MATDDVVIAIRADVAEFQTRIDAARKKIGKFKDELDKTDKVATKTTSSMEKNAAAARAVGGRFGELAERFANAHKALGTVGVVALGTASAFGAAAAGAVALAAGAVALTKAAISAADELGNVIDVTWEEQQALDAAEASFQSFDRAMAQATVTAGASLAPGMSELTETFAQLTLAADDAADSVGFKMDGAFLAATFGGTQLAAVMDILDRATKEYEDDVRGLAGELEEFGEKQSALDMIWEQGTEIIKDREKILKAAQDAERERLRLIAEALKEIEETNKRLFGWEQAA